jgi:hypothetical protein
MVLKLNVMKLARLVELVSPKCQAPIQLDWQSQEICAEVCLAADRDGWCKLKS